MNLEQEVKQKLFLGKNNRENRRACQLKFKPFRLAQPVTETVYNLNSGGARIDAGAGRLGAFMASPN